nr:septum formation family protein [Arthrobacter sp. C9C5]
MDFQLGDCFKDFDANAATSTVVACNTGHSAQLVAVDHYAVDAAYPGRDPLKQKALDTCKAAPLTDKSGNYDFSYKLAYPSSSSWGNGDRRVDCYFVADGGNVVKESLIPRL